MNTLLVSMLSDGQGNTSMMRVTTLLVVGAVLGAKIYNGVQQKHIEFDSTDWEMIATVVGGKLIQNTQEK